MTPEEINRKLAIAKDNKSYHDRSVSHTFTNSGGNVSIDTMKWMAEEGRRLDVMIFELEKELESTRLAKASDVR